MSGKYERTFEVRVPVERVWRAFTDPEELGRLFEPPGELPEELPEQPDPVRKVLEVEPLRRLRWSQEGPGLPDGAEFTVVFESTEDGSRFTVTRYSFGEGEDAEVFGESNGLGFEHGFRDLVMYLETGQQVKRHYYGCTQSAMGMVYAERDWGVEVCRVEPGGFADEAGLRRGDRLVSVGRVPIYTRSDLWLLNGAHPPGTGLEVDFVRGRERRSGVGRLSELSKRAVGE